MGAEYVIGWGWGRGEGRNAWRILVEKPEGQRAF
jgi:hypothetical protein